MFTVNCRLTQTDRMFKRFPRGLVLLNAAVFYDKYTREAAVTEGVQAKQEIIQVSELSRSVTRECHPAWSSAGTDY